MQLNSGVRRTVGRPVPEFRCPRCDGSRSSRWVLPSPLLLHWVLNPALALNELALRQRVARETSFCETCPGPKAQRSYLGCPGCGSWHSTSLWAGSRAFGNWLGYVCPDCGADIPCLRNFCSTVLLTITAPFWWLSFGRYRSSWREWQRNRVRDAATSGLEAIPQVNWIKVGVVYWGVPTGLVFSFGMAFFGPGTYWQSLGWLLAFMPLWIAGGVGFGLTMKWVVTKWGVS